MTEVPAGELRRGDVIRVSASQRGLGRKAIVLKTIPRSETVEINYAVVSKGHDRLMMISANEGLSYARPEQPVPWLGRWDGIITTAASGRIANDESTTNGEGHMATATKGTRKGSKSGSKAKSGAKASSAKASNAGRTRASNEELDELASKVVKLRDSDGKSWGDIGDELDIAPGRLRQLYNRGGGKPNRVKATKSENGSKTSGTKKSGSKGKSAASKRAGRKDPSAKG